MVGKQKGKKMKFVKKAIAVIIVLAALAFGGRYLYNTYVVSAEQKITAGIERLRQAGIKRSATEIMNEVAESYKDPYSANRKELEEKVKYWAFTNLSNEVEVKMNDLSIQVAPDEKSATAMLTVSGNKPVQDVLSLLNPGGKVQLTFVNADGKWLISHVEALK